MLSKSFQYSLIVAFGGFIFGLDAAIISGTVKFISIEFNLSDLQLGSVVGAPGLGVVIALLFTGLLTDRYGRKNVLLGIAMLYIVSAISSALAPTFEALIAARFLGGLAFTSLTVSAMYIGEIAPAHLRGKLVSSNQINIVVGLSTAYFLNYIILQLSDSQYPWVQSLGLDEHIWRWMLATEVLPAIAWLALLVSVPRSPRWLLFRGREAEARLAMGKLRPAGVIDEEIETIKGNIDANQDDRSLRSQFKILISKRMRLAFFVGLTIAIAQQTTGINAVLFYAPTVFEQVGIGTDAAFMQAVFVGLSSLVFTLLALLLIDKVGRRPLTLWGLLWLVISLAVCGFAFRSSTYTLTNEVHATLAEVVDTEKLSGMVGIEYSSDIDFKNALKEALGPSAARAKESQLIQEAANMPSTLILFGILSFICAFHFSVGPVMWVLFSEIFPIAIRSLAIPFFALITSIVSYLVQQFFPVLLNTFGADVVFFLYAGVTFIGWLVLVKILPETKNKSLEEIERSMSGILKPNIKGGDFA